MNRPSLASRLAHLLALVAVKLLSWGWGLTVAIMAGNFVACAFKVETLAFSAFMVVMGGVVIYLFMADCPTVEAAEKQRRTMLRTKGFRRLLIVAMVERHQPAARQHVRETAVEHRKIWKKLSQEERKTLVFKGLMLRSFDSKYRQIALLDVLAQEAATRRSAA